MDRDGEATRAESPAPVEPVVVPRWVQLVLLPLGVLGLYTVARAAGTVLLLFIVAGVIALILNPMVVFVQRAHLPRTAAVLVVYLGFFTTLTGAGFLLANPIADQASSFADDVPGLVDDAEHGLDDVQTFFDDNGINVQIKAEGDDSLNSLESNITDASGDIVAATGDILRQLIEIGFYLVLILVLSIYMLIYGPSIGALVRALMPPGDGTPEDDFPTRVQHAVYSYVRGQLLFSLIMGVSAGLALWVFGTIGIFEDGRTYALAFGLFFGIMELVPYVGPVLGALPPVLVALVQDPLTAVWVALLFLALQQLEGHVVAPNVFGRTLRLNPLIVIFALLLGGEVYGFVGALLALPIAAIVRETVVYLRRHLVFEPWSAGPSLQLAAPVTRPPPGDRREDGDEDDEEAPAERDEDVPAARPREL
jgi:predicted PurR-regulated permease PerM